MNLEIVRTEVAEDVESRARNGELPAMSFPQQVGRRAIAWRVEKGKQVGEWSEQSVSGIRFLVSLVPIRVGRQLNGEHAAKHEVGFAAGLSFMTQALLAYSGPLSSIKEILLVLGREPETNLQDRLWVGLALRVEDV